MMLIMAAATVPLPAPVPVAFDAAARAGLPAVAAVLAAHGASERCTGVRLADLVARAGVPAGDAVRGGALAMVVVAEGADGYRVVFSLGELDARLGNADIIVADACGGKPLAGGDGPIRLVAAGEARGARSVRQLVRLTARVVER